PCEGCAPGNRVGGGLEGLLAEGASAAINQSKDGLQVLRGGSLHVAAEQRNRGATAGWLGQRGRGDFVILIEVLKLVILVPIIVEIIFLSVFFIVAYHFR